MKFWREKKLFGLACCLLAGLLISMVLSFTRDELNSTMLKAGDFPGFYAPAVIIARGQSARLYEPALQLQIENEYWPEFFKGNYYMSVYPPYTMALLSPLGYLTPQTARHVFSLLILAAFSLSLYWLKCLCSWSGRQTFIVAMLLLALAPVFYALIGGQNTAFSMLLYAGMLYFSRVAAEKKSACFEFLTGLCAGLWLFKPQFGVFACLFVLFSFRSRMILGSLIAGLFYYFLGSMMLGVSWPVQWLRALGRFSAENYLANQHNQVSLMGVYEALMRLLSLPGANGLAAAGFLSVLYLAFLVHFRSRKEGGDWRRGLILFGPLLVILSPQTLFYDIGIAFVSVMLVLKPWEKSQILGLLVIMPALWALVLWREALSLPVLSVISLACLIFVWRSQSDCIKL